MQRDHAMHERLLRWGSWVASGGVVRSEGVSSIYAMRERPVATGDNLWTGRVPFDSLEAGETDAAVRALIPELRRTVQIVYVRALTLGRERQAKMAGCSVRQLGNRLAVADLHLHRWLDNRRAMREQAAAYFRSFPVRA